MVSATRSTASSSTRQRPRPAISRDTKFFWDGIDQGELRIQQCRGCRALHHPPRVRCPECGGYDLGYRVSAAPHTASVAYGRCSPRFRGANEAKQLFNQAADALWNGTEPSAKALLERIQPEIEAVLARERKR